MFKEVRLVRAVLSHKPGAVDALVHHLETRKRGLRRTGPRDYLGAWGCIRVCDDIYGYEVKLGWSAFAELVDCRPGSYGLTKEEGDRVFMAVLTCIPTSIPYNKGKVRNDVRLQS